jgi:DNA-binding NarL/FixJ family response regulator
MDGIEVIRRLKQSEPAIQVLLLTMHEDAGLLREAVRAGASGYVVKRAAEADLISAIQAIRRGELYVHPALTRALLQDSQSGSPPTKESEALSSRETDVLRLLAEGFTNRQIAEMLSLSVRTVESHRASVMAKLGLHNRADLARYAAEHGLLQPPR